MIYFNGCDITVVSHVLARDERTVDPERVGSGHNEGPCVPLTCGVGDCRRSAEWACNFDAVGVVDCLGHVQLSRRASP